MKKEVNKVPRFEVNMVAGDLNARKVLPIPLCSEVTFLALFSHISGSQLSIDQLKEAADRSLQAGQVPEEWQTQLEEAKETV